MGDFTDLLYARPSFLEGMARVLDIGGTLQHYSVSATGEDADARALAADVHAIGADLHHVLAAYIRTIEDNALL
jgi:predicted methyltransferase